MYVFLKNGIFIVVELDVDNFIIASNSGKKFSTHDLLKMKRNKESRRFHIVK
jgi:hypothetical protein